MLVVASPHFDTPAAASLRDGWPVISVDSLTAAALARHEAVLFDIDLGNLETVGRVRAARSGLAEPPVSIFAVARGRDHHLSVTQANALGGRAVIPRPYSAADVERALRSLDMPVPSAIPVAATARASIDAAHRILGACFAALSTGAPLDCDGAADASRDLLLDVGQASLNDWIETVRAHHGGTFQHCLLVTGAAVAYAQEADLPEADRTTLTMAALLHDIGKAQIPNAILDKPGGLTAAELALVRQHPRIGADYLLNQRGVPADVIDVVLHHHEYLDGSGYPEGLSARRIGRLTRIVTVCDVYGALVEQRSYKPARSQANALYILISMAQQGKVDFSIVRMLAAALGAKLPATMTPEPAL